ncbi:MAG: hypothetical protein ABSC19_08650 [Syntrophorhabdales bacterium]|jgi:hypothetical protein
MTKKHYLCVVLCVSFLALFLGHEAFAQGTWTPIPVSGIPVDVSSSGQEVSAPVAPPPPNMMPPAPPPPGSSYVPTGGVSEYGSTVLGGTTLMTTGTGPIGPGMAQTGSPLQYPPYLPPETQTDATLRELYPSGTVHVRSVSRTDAGVPPAPGTAAPTEPAGLAPGPAAAPLPSSPGTPPAATEGARSGSTLPFGSGDVPGTVGGPVGGVEGLPGGK